MALFLLKSYLKVDSKSARRYRQIARNLGIKKLKKVNAKDWDSSVSSAWIKAHNTALRQITNSTLDNLVSFTGKEPTKSAEKNINRLTTIKDRKLTVSELSNNELLTTAFAEPEATEEGKVKIKMTQVEFDKYIKAIVPTVKETKPVVTGNAKYKKDDDGKKVLISGTETTKTSKTYKFSEPKGTDLGKLKLLVDKNVRGINIVTSGGKQNKTTGEEESTIAFNYVSSSGKNTENALEWDGETNEKDSRFTNKERIEYLSKQMKSIKVAQKLVSQHIKANKSPSEKILQFLSKKGTERLAPKLQAVRNPLELKERLMGLEFLFDTKNPKKQLSEEEDPPMLDTINESFDKLSELYKEYNKFRTQRVSGKENLKRVILNMNVLLSNINQNIQRYAQEVGGEMFGLGEIRTGKETSTSVKGKDIIKSTQARSAFGNFEKWFSNKDGHFYPILNDTHHLYSFLFKITKTVTRKLDTEGEDPSKIITTPSYQFNQFKITETHEINRSSVDTRVKSGVPDEQGYYTKYRRKSGAPKPLYALNNDEKQSLSYFVSSLKSGLEKLENRLNN